MRNFGVHSEVGKLRTVMVCRPGLAHERLTPGNCRELLFDDVIWVHEAQKDHYDFVLKMQERDIEVLEFHDLLEQTLQIKEARSFILDRRITPNSVGTLATAALRPWLDDMPAKALGRALDWRHRNLRTTAGRSLDRTAECIRRHAVPRATHSKHPVSARSILLDIRGRRVRPDVLAGPQA